MFLTEPERTTGSRWMTETVTVVPVDGERVRIVGGKAVSVLLSGDLQSAGTRWPRVLNSCSALSIARPLTARRP